MRDFQAEVPFALPQTLKRERHEDRRRLAEAMPKDLTSIFDAISKDNMGKLSLSAKKTTANMKPDITAYIFVTLIDLFHKDGVDGELLRTRSLRFHGLMHVTDPDRIDTSMSLRPHWRSPSCMHSA